MSEPDERRTPEQVEAASHDDPDFAEEHSSVTGDPESRGTEPESPERLGGMDFGDGRDA